MSDDRVHLVTGGAGFIGSTLVDRLVATGHRVRLVDCFTPYYDPLRKRSNISQLADHELVEVVEADLLDADLDGLLDGVGVVYHLAAQPGVRLSWADGFPAYVSANVVATQRLLEAARGRALSRFVYASSSSVYGQAERYPCREDDVPQPFSPYGVTKLAAEHLCGAYAANWGVPAVSLRYFTVYGPRQRPDMAMFRLIRAALGGEPFPMYGDGTQIRCFTYVDDVVDATERAGTAPIVPGAVLNVAGGSEVSLREVIDTVSSLSGREVPLIHVGDQAGDVDRTGATGELAREALGWAPRWNIERGLRAQLDAERLLTD